MDKLRKVLFVCLQEAGKIVRRGFGGNYAIKKKSAVSIVTGVDLASEKKIVSIIRKNFPSHQILTEETKMKQNRSEVRWIIDPLDGTTNFAHRVPIFCVSIGVEFQGKMVLGGITNPMSGELYFAEKGKGAMLNGKRIHVSKTKNLIDGLMVTGFPYDRQKKAAFYLKYVKVILEKTQGIRRLGAAALDFCFVASGKFDAFWEFNLNPWDVAAGVLMVEEAGGKVTDFYNQPLEIQRPFQMLASNGRIHSKVLSIFSSLGCAQSL